MRFLSRRPFLAFAAIAYGFSWTLWILAIRTAEGPIALVLVHLAGFGPWVAALIVLAAQGQSVGGWMQGLFRWRRSLGWYVFALGWPIVLVIIASVAYGRLGYTLNGSLLPSRLVAYLPSLIFLVLVGGGNEEPGWRGFGLPLLQQRYSPFVATCILGPVWALWHLPLLAVNPDVASGAIALGAIAQIAGVTLLSITLHAFWYTWLVNRTGSVWLCMLLHASYNAANGLLVLVPSEALVGESYRLLLGLMTSVLGLSVLALLVATKGQLGARHRQVVGTEF